MVSPSMPARKVTRQRIRDAIQTNQAKNGI